MFSNIRNRMSSVVRSSVAAIVTNLVALAVSGVTVIQVFGATCNSVPKRTSCIKNKHQSRYVNCVTQTAKGAPTCKLPAGKTMVSYPSNAMVSCAYSYTKTLNFSGVWVTIPKFIGVTCVRGTAKQLTMCFKGFQKCGMTPTINKRKSVCWGVGTATPHRTPMNVRNTIACKG
jgi:hypothetical protein